MLTLLQIYLQLLDLIREFSGILSLVHDLLLQIPDQGIIRNARYIRSVPFDAILGVILLRKIRILLRLVRGCFMVMNLVHWDAHILRAVLNNHLLIK